MSDARTNVQRRGDVLLRLRRVETEIRALGAEAIFLFGSVARDGAQPKSDIDLFVDPDPGRPFGFMEFMDVHEFLRDRVDLRVSVTTREALHPALRTSIEQDSVRVF